MDVDLPLPSAPVGPPVSPLLALPGAVPDTGRDAGTAWHYSDPVREQRLLAAGSAVTDLSHRGVVRVCGPDRLGWLHSLTTQHLTGLVPGRSTESLVLSPRGYPEHALHLVDDGDSTWITVEPGTAGGLVAWLEAMRPPLRSEVSDVGVSDVGVSDVGVSDVGVSDVGVSDETAHWAAVGLTGVPGGWAAGLDGAPPVWQDPWPTVAEGSVSCAEVPDADHPGLERPWREVLLPRAELVERLDGVPLAGSWAAEALRVAAWRPRLGAETDHWTVPHEVDWLRTAVHLGKGCCRWQEAAGRVDGLARPPRRLVLLHLDGSEHTLPGVDDLVTLSGHAVGRVTTAARHHELGPVALALVRRSVAPDAPLVVAGLAAAQEIVVRP